MKKNRNSRTSSTSFLLKLGLLGGFALSSQQLALSQTARIYAGGVSGCGAGLAPNNNSNDFRAAGGGVFIHSVGWENHTSESQKNAIRDLWANREWGIEMGFSNDNTTARQNAYRRRYLDRGIEADYIAVNAYSSGRVLDPDEWVREREAYYDLGIPRSTAIYATFEYQNHPNHFNILGNNLVSDRRDFQRVIEESGGLVLDTPPRVYFRRLANERPAPRRYKDWVIDAIKWSKDRGHKVGVIVSPNSSRRNYDEDTERFINELRAEDALPDFFIAENYSTEDPSTYDNEVGNEDTRHHQLGCARLIQTEWFPAASYDLDTTYRSGDFDQESHPSDNRRVRRGNGTVGYIRSGTWIRFEDFNFSSNPGSIDIECATPNSGGRIDVRLNSPTGRRIGQVNVTRTGAWGTFRNNSANLDNVTGTRDLYFVFNAPNGGFNLRNFEIKSGSSLPPLSIGRSYDWTGNNAEPIRLKQMTVRNIANNHLTLDIPSGSNDPFVRFLDTNVNGDVYTHVRFRVRNNTNGTNWRIFFNAGDGEGGNSIPVTVRRDNDLRTYTVDMTSDPDWNGNIRTIRIDTDPNDAGNVTFAYVRVVTAP